MGPCPMYFLYFGWDKVLTYIIGDKNQGIPTQG